MKCIHCARDSKLSERGDGRCPGCGRAFAFEPTKQDGFTDPAFASAVTAVSAGGDVKFTADNLYYELARREHRRGKGSGRRQLAWGIGMVLVGLLLGFSVDEAAWVPVLVFPGGVGLALAWQGVRTLRQETRRVTLPRPQFDAWLGRWTEVHGAPQGLIVPRPAPRRAARHRRSELEHYSFDRAVVCDRRETVDLLIANNFHFENNCAVLGVGGYPEHVFDSVRTMLRKNPRLTVYALHDASAEGCALARTLATDPAWFAGHARVVDVGLHPWQVERFRGLWLPALPAARTPGGPRLPADPAARAWLRLHRLELAALRPEQVLKRLFRAMATGDASAARGARAAGVASAAGVALVGADLAGSVADGGLAAVPPDPTGKARSSGAGAGGDLAEVWIDADAFDAALDASDGADGGDDGFG